MIQPSAPLTTIPSELRVKILQYLLPEFSANSTWDQHATRYRHHQIIMRREKAGSWIGQIPKCNQYSILSVNRQISAEAKRLIHDQSFQTSLCEGSDIMESIQADFRAETPGLMEEPSWLPAVRSQ